MGQRLNIEIVSNGELLANSYYHWSGYSNTAIIMTEGIIEEYKRRKDGNKGPLFAIRLLESTGAGAVDPERFQEILKMPDVRLQKCKGRNEGMIDIEPKEMQDNRAWEEGRVTIDIAKETFDFDVLEYRTEEDVCEVCENDEEEIHETDIKLKEIPFENVFEIEAFIKKADYKDEYIFHSTVTNKYFSFIL